MLSPGAVLLAVALGVGRVPLPECVTRFPNPDYWPGRRSQQVSHMLEAIRSEAGTALRTSGPGPQQLAARWRAGTLSQEERVAVLLAGATYHDPALLPAYADALRSSDFRERQAAMVGVSWFLGLPAPDPTSLADDRAQSEAQARLVDLLVAETRSQSLVSILLDSYVASVGGPAGPGLALRLRPDVCLRAIREIAGPEDLREVVALWPLLATESDRRAFLGTVEMLTLQNHFAAPKDPKAASTKDRWMAALRQVDAWVGAQCSSVDGVRVLRATLAAVAKSSGREMSQAEACYEVYKMKHPPAWPTLAAYVEAFGAPAVELDRQRPDNPKNEETMGKMMNRLRDRLPITMNAPPDPRRARARPPLR